MVWSRSPSWIMYGNASEGVEVIVAVPVGVIVGVSLGIEVLVGVKVRVAVGVSVAKSTPRGWFGLVSQTRSRMTPITTSAIAPYISSGPLWSRRFR
jgi:hypothetical protein